MSISFGSIPTKEDGDEMGYVPPTYDVWNDDKKLAEWCAGQIAYYRRMRMIIVVVGVAAFLFLAFCLVVNEQRRMEDAEEPPRVEEDL